MSAQSPGSGIPGGSTVTSGTFRRSSSAIATGEQFVSRARKRLECTWVAESNGQTMGFVVVVADEVEQIYVDAKARGSGPMAYMAETEVGPLAVPSHRYEIDLADPAPGDLASH